MDLSSLSLLFFLPTFLTIFFIALLLFILLVVFTVLFSFCLDWSTGPSVTYEIEVFFFSGGLFFMEYWDNGTRVPFFFPCLFLGGMWVAGQWRWN